MYIVTSKQMLAAETNAVSRGLSFAYLMESAGKASADIIFDTCCENGKNILVISGKGKNGGDGFVIARILKEKGCSVRMLLPCGRPTDDISINNMKLVDEDIIFETDNYSSLIKECDVIVDAVFGTGFKGCLNEKLSLLAEEVNSSEKTIVSIDIPSGACCDTASVEGNCFEADLTIAISALKPIHVMKPGNEVCGTVIVADIDILPEDYENINTFTYNEEDICTLLPERPQFSNKGTFGNALCIAGSRNMPGAAKTAFSGAVKSGVGLVTAAFPDAAYNAIAPSIMEQVMMPCISTENGSFSIKSYSSLIEKSKKCTSALIGCGIGTENDTKKLVRKLIKHIEIPSVIDADGLNALSEEVEILNLAKAPMILTPHPGEMSRLCGKSVSDILQNPIETAREFADKYDCTLVLKGANTIVCQGGNDKIYVNTTGNSGLAKGGSGDLLSGIMVSLLAQGMSAFDAAVSAVFIHGDCADEVALMMSERGMTVSDIITHLPYYLGKFE